MKKISAAAAAVMLAFSMTMTVFAANTNVNDVPDDKNIDVQAVYVGEFEDVTIGTVGDDDPVPLPDGGEIKIDTDNEDDVGLRYVITLITPEETEAYDFVSGAVSEIGEDIYAVHIAFYKGDEKVEPSGNVTITMTSPNGYDSAEFVYITADSQLTDIEREIVGEDIVFDTDKGGYYVLVNEDESSVTDSSSYEQNGSSEESSEVGSAADSSSASSVSETGSSSKVNSSSGSSGSSGAADKNTSNPNTGIAVGTGAALIGGLAFTFVKGKRDKDE